MAIFSSGWRCSRRIRWKRCVGNWGPSGWDRGQAFITKAPHGEVPGYLAASDFAFATIKPAPCRLFCSAVKIGEYWANGLPVLLTPGVGGDSAIIAAEKGGAVFDLIHPGSVPSALMHQPDYRIRIHALAVRYRSLNRTREAYDAHLPLGEAARSGTAA